jgi:hypothetical protein
MVPHANRHELYAGDTIYVDHPGKNHENKKIVLQPNESPVNLFNVDFHEFPNVAHVEHRYSEFLTMGDCVFVPAFYWYQFAAEAEPSVQKGPFKPAAIMVNIHYKGNSDLLQAFYSAVESGVLL